MRTRAVILASVWQDDDFTALPRDAQLAYFTLLSQPTLAATGVIAFTPRRWLRLSDWTAAALRSAIHALEAARFVAVDRDSEELLIRSYMRHDGILRQPNMLKKAQREYAAITSPRLRALLASEYPDVFADSRAEPFEEPFREGFAEGMSRSEGEGEGLKVLERRSSLERARDVDAVWSEYARRHPQARLTKARRDLIRRRLADGYIADDLVAAIAGNHADPHCNGDNDRGREYHAIELILRDAAHVEEYGAIARRGVLAKRGSEATNGSRRIPAEDRPPRRVVPISELLGGEG